MLPKRSDQERQSSLAKTKKSIIGILRTHEAVSLDQLLAEMDAEEIGRISQVKAAIWVLIAESMVELTPKYEIKAGPAFPVTA